MPSPAPLSRRRALALGATTVLLTLVLGALLVEGLVRFGLGDRDYAMEMWKYAHVLKRVTGDKAQVFAHRPNARARLMGVDVRINSLGLRGPETTYAKPPGVRRVLMLGDSLAFGWGVAEEETTSARLQKLLAERLPRQRWEVIDAGVGNYNTRLEVHYLEQAGLRFDPDVVVLNYFINDAEPDPSYSGNFVNEHSEAWVFLANRVDALARRFGDGPDWRDYYRGLYATDAAGWRGARAALARLGELCRSHRLVCLVADQPELHVLSPYPFADVRREVEREVRADGLPYLDLRPELKGLDPASLWVSREDSHPNGRCDAVYARALADRLGTMLPPATSVR